MCKPEYSYTIYQLPPLLLLSPLPPSSVGLPFLLCDMYEMHFRFTNYDTFRLYQIPSRYCRAKGAGGGQCKASACLLDRFRVHSGI